MRKDCNKVLVPRMLTPRPQPPQRKPWNSAPSTPIQSPAKSDSDSFLPKLPNEDSPYVKAKHVQLIDRDPSKSISLFWSAINCADRTDSALKDMAVVMKQLNRTDEAIEAIKSFRHLCTNKAQESLDNVLIDLYKRAGRMDEHVELLDHKLKLIEDGVAFGGKTTKISRSQGKKFHVSIEQERSRLLGNMAWAYIQQNQYQKAEELYRKALLIEPDKNKQCNLAICLMQRGNIEEAKPLLLAITPTPSEREIADSYIKSFDRAYQLLRELETQSDLKGKSQRYFVFQPVTNLSSPLSSAGSDRNPSFGYSDCEAYKENLVSEDWANNLKGKWGRGSYTGSLYENMSDASSFNVNGRCGRERGVQQRTDSQSLRRPLFVDNNRNNENHSCQKKSASNYANATQGYLGSPLRAKSNSELMSKDPKFFSPSSIRGNQERWRRDEKEAVLGNVTLHKLIDGSPASVDVYSESKSTQGMRNMRCSHSSRRLLFVDNWQKENPSQVPFQNGYRGSPFRVTRNYELSPKQPKYFSHSSISRRQGRWRVDDADEKGDTVIEGLTTLHKLGGSPAESTEGENTQDLDNVTETPAMLKDMFSFKSSKSWADMAEEDEQEELLSQPRDFGYRYNNGNLNSNSSCATELKRDFDFDDFNERHLRPLMRRGNRLQVFKEITLSDSPRA